MAINAEIKNILTFSHLLYERSLGKPKDFEGSV